MEPYECGDGIEYNHWHGTSGDDVKEINIGFGDYCLDGLAGNDTIDGNDGRDWLMGRNGNEIELEGDGSGGGGGSDMVIGGPGNDDGLRGFPAQDYVYDGPGSDTVNGGAGNNDTWRACDDDTYDNNTGGFENTPSPRQSWCNGPQP